MSKTEVQDVTRAEALHSTAIMISVEMESNFKLYSYRIIDKDTFINRAKELAQELVNYE